MTITLGTGLTLPGGLTALPVTGITAGGGTRSNAYTTEDGITPYTTEDGTSNYTTET